MSDCMPGHQEGTGFWHELFAFARKHGLRFVADSYVVCFIWETLGKKCKISKAMFPYFLGMRVHELARGFELTTWAAMRAR